MLRSQTTFALQLTHVKFVVWETSPLLVTIFQELVGKGYAGPAVDEDGVTLTAEQREWCRTGGLDERQLRMLKAIVSNSMQL